VREARKDIADLPGNKLLCNAVSVRSVYRWIKLYTDSDGDLRQLIPETYKRGGKGESRLHPTAEQILLGVIDDLYAGRETCRMKEIWEELALRIEEENRVRAADPVPLPSLATVARRVREIDVQIRLEKQYGKRGAKHRLTQFKKTPYPERVLARVEIDHTPLDLIILDDDECIPLGRPTLTMCIDMATRYPLGMYLGFEPPSYYTVMECLYHAILPKPSFIEQYGCQHDWLAYGVPNTLVIDNGKEFIGRDLEDACMLLGIALQYTPVRMPHFKAGVERYFKTQNDHLTHTLPGTTFSSIWKRRDYDSVKHACIFASDVGEVLSRYLVDYYAVSFHRGLNDIPADRWEALTAHGFIPRLPPNAQELNILLGRVDHRVIHHYGIEWNCIRYNSPNLVDLRTRMAKEKDKRVKIKYHPGDLSRVHVYDPFNNCYIETPAVDQAYTDGLSLWKHRVIRQRVLRKKKKVNPAALAQARREIRDLVEQGLERKSIRKRTHRKVARWRGKGQSLIPPQAADDVPASTEPASNADEPPEPVRSRVALPELNLDEPGWGISYSER
jgi:putative transposase